MISRSVIAISATIVVSIVTCAQEQPPRLAGRAAAGATWDGVGVNFAIFSEYATRVELLSLRRGRCARWNRCVLRCRSKPTWSGTATCPTSVRGSSTAIASTARTAAGRSSLQPAQVVLDPYAKVIGRETRMGRRERRLQDGRRPRRSLARRSRQRAFAPLAAVMDDGVYVGGRSRHRGRRGTRRSSTSCT